MFILVDGLNKNIKIVKKKSQIFILVDGLNKNIKIVKKSPNFHTF